MKKILDHSSATIGDFEQGNDMERELRNDVRIPGNLLLGFYLNE